MGFDSSSADTSCDETLFIDEYPKINEIENENDRKIKRTHICTVIGCNKAFYRPSKLKRHTSFHTGEKPYTCLHEGCDKRYTNSSHLKRHNKTVHEKIYYKTSVSCPVATCRRQLANKDCLSKHYIRYHSSEKRKFKCTHCTTFFYRKAALAKHVFEHTGMAPYNCERCGRGFTARYLYNKHMRYHNTYTCECGDMFHRWSLLLVHKKLNHVVEYECDICHRKFRAKANLKFHMNVHLENKKVYLCPHDKCPRFYNQERNLNQHMKVAHDRERYQCTFEGCLQSLASNQKLIAHVRLHTTNRLPSIRKKNTRKRKDVKKPKKAMALILAGLDGDHNFNKKVLSGEHVDDLELPNFTTSEGESDDASSVNYVETVLNIQESHIFKIPGNPKTTTTSLCGNSEITPMDTSTDETRTDNGNEGMR